MVAAQPRDFTRLAIAIVIASVVIGGSIVASSYLGTSHTVTETTTSILTRTGTSQLYQVEFLQESNCPYGSWLYPWGVTVGNQTIVQPSNATLPLSYNGSHLTGESNYSTIWFSLPNGTYSYTIIPNDPLGSHQSGDVTVDGSNLTILVYGFVEAMGCSSTTSTSS